MTRQIDELPGENDVNRQRLSRLLTAALWNASLTLAWACSAADSPTAADVGGASEGQSSVAFEVRDSWGRDGYWLSVSPSGEVSIAESDEALEAIDQHRASCRAASIEAYDTLHSASHGTLPVERDARKYLAVVPSPTGRWAFIHGVHHAALDFADLATGTLRMLPGELSSHGTGPVVWSPNGRRVALFRRSENDQEPVRQLVVLDIEEKAVVLETQLGPDFSAMSWSPDGTKLAVLMRQVQPDEGVVGRVTKAMGHGTYSSTFDLVVVDIPSGSQHRGALLSQVSGGRGEIVWDAHSTSSMMGDVFGGLVKQAEPPSD